MKYRACWSLALLLCAAQPVASATQEPDRPDQKMLKMIDLLRDMDTIKQMEMLQDLQHLEASGDPVNNTAPRKAASSTTKESRK